MGRERRHTVARDRAETPKPGRELVRSLTRGARVVGIASNMVGAVIVFASLVFVGRSQRDIPAGRTAELGWVFAGLLLAIVPPVFVFMNRSSFSFRDELERGVPLSDSARRDLLRTPWLSALTSLTIWCVSAVVFSVYAALRLNMRADAIQLGFDIVLAGLVTMAVVYLLTERVLRPAFAIAFDHEPPRESRAVGVGPRLLLAWVLGGAVPMAFIANVLLDSENAGVNFAIVQRVGYGFLGLAAVIGSVITWRVARSVSAPLARMREAMATVAAGGLDASVEVDDATEVGVLQAGFNQMVDGLRERERLRDLFGRHVGDAVARRALERGVELGGEIRRASVLFVDLAGSTTLAATRSPADVVALLNAFFRAVVAATEIDDGWVNKFEGDAALCVFGVPVGQETHAAGALQSARRLRTEIRRLQERYPEIDAGIGVSTGDVLAGNVGAEHRYEYTVIGDPVNEAARLTEAAKERPGRVLASERSVREGGEESARWREVAVLTLRGRTEPTRAYEPVEARPE